MEARLTLWGPELSPFVLKVEAMLRAARLPFRRLPRDGSRLENIATIRQIRRAVRAGTALRPPAGDPLDEYPSVPYLVTGTGDVLYDSTALAAWIDAEAARSAPAAEAPGLVPADPACRMIASFVDEAFDEWGLYMVHHNRWKLAAGDNDSPGRRLATEFRRFLPPLVGAAFAWWFERRQVRRLPYLFSVAPDGYRVEGLPRGRTPPSRPGFPPTHDLLERSWERTLSAMEALLARQPWLLGGRFTIADASAYGQLSMNLTDAAAERRLLRLAPGVHAWLRRIRDAGPARGGQGAGLFLDDALAPLLAVFADTFGALMRANEAAYERHLAAGQRLFNEAAFDAGVALFDADCDGQPCRGVVKTFQVRAWRDLRRQWKALDDVDRDRAAALLDGRAWIFDEPAAGPAPAGDPGQAPATAAAGTRQST